MSPPELQRGVIFTLRAALVSAVNTCNKIIAENDVENFQQYEQATTGMNMPSSTPKPTQFYDVVHIPDVEETAVLNGLGANSIALEYVYNKLQAAAGNGKMGLREDLTSAEASDLADSSEMSPMLMDEFDSRIPEADPSNTVAHL